MTTYPRFVSARICMTAGSLLLVLAMPSLGQQVTGQWDFNNGNLAATVGTAGQYWIAPTTPPRDVETETQFGTTTSFLIPDIGGVAAKVMKFPQTDPKMGYAMYPEIDANGGGSYVNQYTLIMDVLYPAASLLPAGEWNALFQTNDCNGNDGDLFVREAVRVVPCPPNRAARYSVGSTRSELAPRDIDRRTCAHRVEDRPYPAHGARSTSARGTGRA